MEKVKLHTRMYGWKHVWMEFAEEFGTAVDDPHPESSQTGISVSVPMKGTPWMLAYTMDPSTKSNGTHTTVSVNFAPRGDFQFAIHPQTKMDEIIKLLGMQDIIIGDKEFDSHFVVKGNDVGMIRDLFANNELRAYILQEPSIQIWVHAEKTDSRPSPRTLTSQPHVLSMKVPGAVDDFERLKRFYELMELLLKTLCAVEAAVES